MLSCFGFSASSKLLQLRLPSIFRVDSSLNKLLRAIQPHMQIKIPMNKAYEYTLR